jgi:NDP-sugar pyrophosphorylase family protein
VAVLSPDLFAFLPRGEVSCLVEQGLIPMMRAGLRVEGVVQAGRFCDIGTSERFLALQWEVLPGAADLFARRGLPAPVAVPGTPGLLACGRIDVAPDAVVCGPVLACEGSRIGAGAVVGPRVVLSPGAVVEPGARVADAVVLAGVRAAGDVTGIVV